jgi:hypothetical protein
MNEELLPSDVIAEATRQLGAQRDELMRRVTAIEGFLGFAEHANDLAVRVAKIELFLGLKR